MKDYWHCFRGIVLRELLRFIHQKARLIAAMVRPLVWLFIFAVGIRTVSNISNIEPYPHDVSYEEYIVPGLIAMILLFSGMQNALSMVYDREIGSMRALLVSPFPRWYLLASKLFAGIVVAVFQVYVFLLIASIWKIQPPGIGYLTLLPAVIISGLMLGALGLLLSSVIKQLENFAGIMNFVIFPMFFASSALYPMTNIRDSSELLYQLCQFNPFSHAVELIRLALYGEINLSALLVVGSCLVAFFILAMIGYNPSRGFMLRK